MRAGVGRGSASVRANCPKRARNFFAFLNITLSCKFTNAHKGRRWQLEKYRWSSMTDLMTNTIPVV
jgi:hypothetical protein